MRSSIQFAMFFTGFATLAAACSSGGTSGSTSSGAGGTSSASSSSSSSASSTSSSSSSSSSGAGGSAGVDGGDGGPSCNENCITNNMAGAMKFEGYELKECGCAAASPCMTKCTTECTAMMAPTQTSPCGMCLIAESNKGVGSPCSVTAVTGDCQADPVCKPFGTCVLACAGI